MNPKLSFFVLALFIIVVLAGSTFFLLREQRIDNPATKAQPAAGAAAGNLPAVEPKGSTAATVPKHAPSLARPDASQSKYKLEQGLEEFVRQYPSLVSRANGGDAGAARELYENLGQCVGTPLTPTALDDLKKEAAADYGSDSPKYNDAVSFADRRFASCSQFSPDQISDYKRWLRLAAGRGDHAARLSYVRDGQPDPNSPTYWQDTRDFQATAKRYLEEEIASGNSGALFVASTSYTSGGVYGPDIIKQYAYLYAYALAEDITQGAIFDHLKLMAGAMSESDLTSAMSQGESIYKKCCVN